MAQTKNIAVSAPIATRFVNSLTATEQSCNGKNSAVTDVKL